MGDGLTPEERLMLGRAVMGVSFELSPDNPLIPAVERILAAHSARGDDLAGKVAALADAIDHPIGGTISRANTVHAIRALLADHADPQP